MNAKAPFRLNNNKDNKGLISIGRYFLDIEIFLELQS